MPSILVFLNESVDLGCVDSAVASLVDCEAANFREQEGRTLFKGPRETEVPANF